MLEKIHSNVQWIPLYASLFNIKKNNFLQLAWKKISFRCNMIALIQILENLNSIQEVLFKATSNLKKKRIFFIKSKNLTYNTHIHFLK